MPDSFQGRKILMLGIDVYHSKKRYKEENKSFTRRRSLAGMIASFITHEKGQVKYKHYNDVYWKEAGVEVDTNKVFESQDIGNFLKDAINSFEENPDIIIIYRDGVSESQIFAVVNNELKQIISALSDINIDPMDVDIIYSVLQKRIHVRFLAQSNNDYFNPPSGTVVEDCGMRIQISDELGVTSTNSFYLIPTSCDLSTVKPVNYIVIYNDKIKNTIPLEDFQRFTYLMCFLYPNWTDSIKLPVSTQMAHKLAYTLGENCKFEKPKIHPFLKQTLFYL